MDPATTVAVFSFAGVVVTVLGGAVVAIYTNRSEKKTTAETAMEKTLRERIILRDEQIEDLKADVREAEDAKAVTEEKLSVKIIENRELKRQIRELEERLHDEH